MNEFEKIDKLFEKMSRETADKIKGTYPTKPKKKAAKKKKTVKKSK